MKVFFSLTLLIYFQWVDLKVEVLFNSCGNLHSNQESWHNINKNLEHLEH